MFHRAEVKDYLGSSVFFDVSNMVVLVSLCVIMVAVEGKFISSFWIKLIQKGYFQTKKKKKLPSNSTYSN